MVGFRICMRRAELWLKSASGAVQQSKQQTFARHSSHRFGDCRLVALCAAIGLGHACQPMASDPLDDAGTSMTTARLDAPPSMPTDLGAVSASSPRPAAASAVSTDDDPSDNLPHLGDSFSAVQEAGTAAEVPDAHPSAQLSGDGGGLPDAMTDAAPAPDGSIADCELVESAECNPVDGCGCDTGFNCDYSPEESLVFSCVAPGEIAAQDACDNIGECGLGHVCAQGLCAATCRFDVDCSANEHCVQVRTDDGVVKGIRVCERECDPLAPQACGTGATCVLVGNQGIPTCVRQTGQAAVGDVCSAASDCERGLSCAPDGTCRAWCALEMGVAADAGADMDASQSAMFVAAQTSDVCPEATTCEPVNPQTGLGLCGAECQKASVQGSTCGRIPTTCGCDEGETCQALPDGRTACGVPGPKGYMAWCGNNSHCGAELSCLGGLCRPSCDPELLACPDQGECASVVASEQAPTFACMGRCDPVIPGRTTEHFTPCGDGAYCSPGIEGSPFSESYCERGKDRVQDQDESCAWDRDCRNGLGCHPNGTCQPWCRGDSDCSSLQRCDLQVPFAPRFGQDADDAIGLCHNK